MLVVLNPQAGNCNADEVRLALAHHFASETWTTTIYETTGAEDERIPEIVRARLTEEYDLVVAVGGDGTVSEVAEALVHRETPLGIIPLGTANVLARELRIPLDMQGAVALLAGVHDTTTIDAMQVGEKYYITSIGIGVDAVMVRETGREAKRRFGRLAYAWSILTILVGYQPERFVIVADDRRKRVRALQVQVANGAAVGLEPFRWGPHIHVNDGQIDVCIIYGRTLWDYSKLVWHSLRGQHRRSPHVRYMRASRNIIISTDRPLPVQADGELIGNTTLHVQVVPRAIRVIIPST